MPRKCRYFSPFQAFLILTTLVVVMPNAARAQTAQPGNKAVFQTSTTVAPSQAWIDASAFWTQGTQPDLCKIIKDKILTITYGSVNNYPNGAVIDARGLYNNPLPVPSAGAISCTGTPFANFNGSTSPPPTTILLPATKIPIPQTWILPNNMKIIGEEQNTVISVQTGTFVIPDVIDMGSSTLCPNPCSGIAVEHVVINTANNASLNGIVNNYAQFSSYVNDVTFQNIGCAGLIVGAVGGPTSEAANSGPYTNIQFFNPAVNTSCSGGGSKVLYPLCIDIETQTRGVHGATCNGLPSKTSTAPGAAIYVNASNNTVEDLHFERFWDGVQIGDVPSSSTTVANVVVSNAAGGEDGGNSVQIQNIVHICGGLTPGTNDAPCNSIGTVEDVSVLQSYYSTPAFPAGATSLEDDVTGTSIPASAAFTGMYVLGEPMTPKGFSRFNTSPSALLNGTTPTPSSPTWGVGAEPATGTCTTPGALYSNSSGTLMTSVYVCTSSGWKPIA